MNNRIVIRPDNYTKNYFKDFIGFKELLLVFALRDISVKYKQTSFGLLWALIRPLLTMIIFTFVFGRIAKLETAGIPYPVLVLAGVLPWQFFSNSFSEASNSLLNNEALITKAYFPRLILPISVILGTSLEFFICLGLLFILMIWFNVPMTINLLALPFLYLLTILVILGPSLWFASLNVKYRDLRYIIPFMLQLGLFVTPVGFSSSLVPEKWQILYNLNPLVFLIDAFRWSILGSESISISSGQILGFTTIVLTLLISGIYFFCKTEKTFADNI
jgi:lipopolysaccharide transport system permease protein